MGFSRQEHWSGLLFPPLGDLTDPRIKPASLTSDLLWQEGSLPLPPPGKPSRRTVSISICKKTQELNYMNAEGPPKPTPVLAKCMTHECQKGLCPTDPMIWFEVKFIPCDLIIFDLKHPELSQPSHTQQLGKNGKVNR